MKKNYPTPGQAWLLYGERWTVVMTKRLPLGHAIGGLSIESRYDEGWATLRATDGREWTTPIPGLQTYGQLLP